MYKMYLISAEGYKNAKVDFLTIKKTGEIWISMKDVGSGMGVKKHIWFNIKRNIWCLCETKNPTKNKLINIKWQKEKFIKSLLI